MDSAALAATAPPGVADPVQPIAAERGVALAESNWPNGHVMRYARIMRGETAVRQCVSCGVVATVNPELPCGVCNASPFHLIPLAPRAA